MIYNSDYTCQHPFVQHQENPKVNYGLRVRMMPQCSFIGWNKWNTWHRMTAVGRAVCTHDQKKWQIPELSTRFCREPETALCCCFSVAKLPARLLSPCGFPGKNTEGVVLPSPGDLLNPGIKPVSLALAGGSFTTESPGKPITLL